MQHTAAFNAGYEVGYIIGIIMMLALMLGGAVFFVVSVVKAFTTRKTGWIVAAIVSGLPVVVFLLFMVAAFFVGFNKGLKQARQINEAKQGQPSALLSAEMTPFTGNVIPYQISLPGENEWTKATGHHPYDYVFNDGNAYFGTIVEGIGLNTPQRVCDLAKKNLMKKAAETSVTDPQTIQIDSHDWLTFDATATVSGIHIKYRYYVYADTNNTMQLISWTGPTLFDHYAPVFDRIAKSFKFPK